MKSISKITTLALKVEAINTNKGRGFDGVSGDTYIIKDCLYMLM